MKISEIKSRLEYLLSSLYTLIIKHEFAQVGKTTVWWNATINNPQFIKLGNVTIRENSWLYAVKGDQKGNKFNPKIEIQDNVYMGHNLHLTAIDSVVIEKDVMIADKVYISDNYHDYQDINTPVLNQRVFSKGPLIIKEGAFIGENACILGNLTIGRNSVVGAGSVVTKDVSDFTVVTGNPAKEIKKYDQITKTWVKCIKT